MSKIALSAAFLIGHDVIDTEHAELVSILNDMADGCRLEDAGRCQQSWQLLCKKLDQHFTNEENIMSNLGFNVSDHKQHHQEIAEYVKTLGQQSQTLTDWGNCFSEMQHKILSQILKHDLPFAEHLVTIGYNKY